MVDRYPVFVERQNEGDSPDPRFVIAVGQGPANSIETICVGDPFADEIFQAVPENIARERICVTNGKQSGYFKPAEWFAQRFIDQCRSDEINRFLREQCLDRLIGRDHRPVSRLCRY